MPKLRCSLPCRSRGVGSRSTCRRRRRSAVSCRSPFAGTVNAPRCCGKLPGAPGSRRPASMPRGRAMPDRVRHCSAADLRRFGSMSLEDEELVDLGVLDLDGPKVEEQRALIHLALDHGATIDEIRAGIAERRLHAVAAERVVLDGPRLT